MGSRYYYDNNVNISASPTLSRMRAAFLYLLRRYVWDTKFNITFTPTRVTIEFDVENSSVKGTELESEMNRAWPLGNVQDLIEVQNGAKAEVLPAQGSRSHGEETIIDGIFVYVGKNGQIDLSQNGGYDGRLKLSVPTLSKILKWASQP